MPHLISNLIEKNYTPYTVRLAPRNMWSRPQLGRKPQKVSRLGADPNYKAFWRFIRRWVCHNHKLYYTYSILCGIMVYNFWWQVIIGHYRKRNYHRSLAYAVLKEEEWEKIKPKEEDDDEYGDEDGSGEGGEGEAAEGGASEGGEAAEGGEAEEE